MTFYDRMAVAGLMSRKEVETWATWLAEHRELRGWSQVELGNRASLSGSYIALMEQGNRKPTRRNTIIAIANALKADPLEALEVAGLAQPGERRIKPAVTFEDVVRKDPRLRADQKRVLCDIYEVFVGR